MNLDLTKFFAGKTGTTTTMAEETTHPSIIHSGTKRNGSAQLSILAMAVVVVVMMVMNSARPICAQETTSGKLWVNIINKVGGAITLQCASKDNNLGTSVLGNQQNYFFDFHQNIWGSTLFWCNFTWQERTAHVVVWKGHGFLGVDWSPCDYCVWVFMPEGFYRAQVGQVPMWVQGWQYPHLHLDSNSSAIAGTQEILH